MSFSTSATQRVDVTLSDYEAREIATSFLCRLFHLPPDAHVNEDGHVATYERFRGDIDSVPFKRDGNHLVKPTDLERAAMMVLDEVRNSRFKTLS